MEIKSVNHRYLDVGLRMPKKLNSFEADIRDMLKKYAQRGKVDIFITYEDAPGQSGMLKYDSSLAKEYISFFRQIKEEFGLEDDIKVSTLLKCPDVFSMEEGEGDEDEIKEGLKIALKEALDNFLKTRVTEGGKLKKDISAKLDEMSRLLGMIEERAPLILEDYRNRIMTKISEIVEKPVIDENRLAAEVIIYADKICTDEETVRLKSHISHMRDTLDMEEGAGRKLDFIAQEMNREANTVLSKANDLETTNYAIELKTCIEKIREQVQNIE